MYLQQLQLRDYRSWADLTLDLTPGITIFVGRNGFGKTNVVEAIGYLAHLSSHRVPTDAPLVRAGCTSARISATAINNGRQLTAHLLIKAHAANQAQINRTKLKSPRELLGVVHTVLFAPEDLSLLRGEPALRRSYLDTIIATRQPRLAGVKADYDKVLRQRNALLKNSGLDLRSGYGTTAGAAALTALDVWDSQLAHLGAQLICARLSLVDALTTPLAEIYQRIAPESRPASIHYECTVPLEGIEVSASQVEDALVAALGNSRKNDIDRGLTLVGPHRDDLHLMLGRHPAKGFASHGETWSFALALRLAEYHILKSDGTDPILILDDVFAELDSKRREKLVEVTHEAEQVFITAAVGDDLPTNLGTQVRRVTVDMVDAASADASADEQAADDNAPLRVSVVSDD